jgi:hypothetical protein
VLCEQTRISPAASWVAVRSAAASASASAVPVATAGSATKITSTSLA